MGSLLVTLLVVLIVCAIVYWIVGLLPFPPPIKNIILAVLGVVLLVWILNAFGVFGGGTDAWFHSRR